MQIICCHKSVKINFKHRRIIKVKFLKNIITTETISHKLKLLVQEYIYEKSYYMNIKYYHITNFLAQKVVTMVRVKSLSAICLVIISKSVGVVYRITVFR